MDGLSVTCRGWTYTLEDYMAAFAAAGLVVEALREPKPTAPSPNFERWNDMSALLDGSPAEAALSGPAPIQPVVDVVDVVTVTLPSGVIPEEAMVNPAPLLSVHFMPVVSERQVIEPSVIEVS